MLLLQLSLTLYKYCDIEVVFLESTIYTEMYIELDLAIVVCRFMMEEEYQQTTTQLQRSMYGNVNDVIKFLKTLTGHVTESSGINTTQSKVDPYIFYK